MLRNGNGITHGLAHGLPRMRFITPHGPITRAGGGGWNIVYRSVLADIRVLVLHGTVERTGILLAHVGCRLSMLMLLESNGGR